MTSFWNNRRVFVTGATGIVGSWLVKMLLEEKARVTALVFDADPKSKLVRSGMLEQISTVNGALEDYQTLEQAIGYHKIDTVFHLGAQTIVGIAHRSPLATFEANIRGTYHLLEACRVHQKQIKGVVIASSDKAYGEQATLPYTEKMPLEGRHPYEVSKSCADMLSQAYAHTYRLPVAIARCGNIYGGGDLNWSRVVPSTIRSFLLNERPVLRSNGSHIRDYIYVKDAALAYIKLAEYLIDQKVRGEAFNFSAETPTNVLEIVGAIQKLMNCTHIEPDIRNTTPGEIHAQFLSAAKARRLLKWEPEFTLQEGLRETISWYRKVLSENLVEHATEKRT